MNKENKQYLKEAIEGIALSRLKEAIKPVGCSHVWKSFGYGYKCFHCDFYTGTNVVLNDLITVNLPADGSLMHGRYMKEEE